MPLRGLSLLAGLAGLTLLVSSGCQGVAPAPTVPNRPPAAATPRAAPPVAQDPDDALLAQMTLEEKLGQLAQRRGGRSKALNSLIDEAERERIKKGLVGSYLHVAGAAFLRDLQRVAVEESRLRIPLLFAMDVIHGYRTLFPVPLALAASWDPATVEAMARVSAVEATAAGLHWTFSPMVDIARDPRWGRIVEGAGEDAYLGSVMAQAYVRGYQGPRLDAPDSLLSCTKHFAGYGLATGGRDYSSADVSERTMRDVYLPPFQAAIAAGSLSVMSAFQDLSGVPMTANRAYLTDILRGEWGFSGLVVSDWESVAEIMPHGLAASRAEAGKLALLAGTDMDMTSGIYGDDLAAMVRSGALPMAAVDEAVRRVLRVKRALGLFSNPLGREDPAREKKDLFTEPHLARARDVARRSMVLLKNEPRVLPLSKDLKRVAVIGALAADRLSPLGSWRAQARPEDVVTILEGIQRALPRAQVTFARGGAIEKADLTEIPEAVRAARRADAVVLVVGEPGDASGEARSRSSLDLPGAQQQLAEAVLQAGKPTALVLMNGRPLAIERLVDKAAAVLEVFYLGVQMGPAVADVLFGDESPGGKLPVTFPRSVGQVPIFYNHLNSGRPASEDLTKDTARYRDLPITPLFPFGHGLSYTSFAYSALAVSPAETSAGGEISIRLRVKNTGAQAGDEVVQLYVRDPVASVARPVKELKGFQRLALRPGEEKALVFQLPAAALAFPGLDLAPTVEPGRIEVMVGSSSADIRLQGAFTITGPPVRLPLSRPPSFSSSGVERP